MDKDQLNKKLRARWHKLMTGLAVEEALNEELFQELVSHYSDGSRYYHDLGHIANILDAIEKLECLAHDGEAVQLAGWYHDIIYDVKVKDNEIRSADAAGVALRRMGISAVRIEAIQKMIRYTDVTLTPPDDVDCHILLDSDLAKLASAVEEYFENSRAIRREFAFIPEAAYRRGRREVLAMFLDRERIYQTEIMYNRCETKARRNISLEIEALDKGIELRSETQLD